VASKEPSPDCNLLFSTSRVCLKDPVDHRSSEEGGETFRSLRLNKKKEDMRRIEEGEGRKS